MHHARTRASGMQVIAKASPFALAFDKDAASSEPCWPGLSFEDACRTATPPPSQPPPQSTSIARNPGIDTLNTVSTRKAVSAVASTRSLIVGFRAITAPNNSNSS